MATSTAVRSLRNGPSLGEHPPLLSLCDSTSLVTGGKQIFRHILKSLLLFSSSENSQPLGMVSVACNFSPKFYYKLYSSLSGNVANRFHLIDCYSDPLNWNFENDKKNDSLNSDENISDQKIFEQKFSKTFSQNFDLKKLNFFLSKTIQELNAKENIKYFLTIDCINYFFNYNSIFSLSSFLSSLLSNDSIFGIFLIFDSENSSQKYFSILEYYSNALLFLEKCPKIMPSGKFENRGSENDKIAPEGMKDLDDETAPLGVLRLLQKRKNGKVREMADKFWIENKVVNFENLNQKILLENISRSQTNKIRNLTFLSELSETEKIEKSKVVLPFEHQDESRNAEIYSGRSASLKDKISVENEQESVKDSAVEHETSNLVSKFSDTNLDSEPQIFYERDSDNEIFDSDEDPDDDLDI